MFCLAKWSNLVSYSQTGYCIVIWLMSDWFLYVNLAYIRLVSVWRFDWCLSGFYMVIWLISHWFLYGDLTDVFSKELTFKACVCLPLINRIANACLCLIHNLSASWKNKVLVENWRNPIKIFHHNALGNSTEKVV